MKSGKDFKIVDPLVTPGALVRHPQQPDWGLGQVQSVAGAVVTVNFENAGKRTINSNVIDLRVEEIADGGGD